jgi:hypothetical protein
MGDTGVVDQDVEAAECRGRSLRQLGRRLGLREINCGSADLGPELVGERSLGGTEFRAVAAAEHQLRAGRREGPGDVGADSLGGSGDQHAFTVQAQCARV